LLQRVQQGKVSLTVLMALQQPHPGIMGWFTDASFTAMGGYCMELGIWWRLDWLDLMREGLEKDWASFKRRLVGNKAGKGAAKEQKKLRKLNQLSINLFELLGMVVMGLVVIDQEGVRPRSSKEVHVRCVGDNETAIQRMHRRGAQGCLRASALMRVWSVLEVVSGFRFDAMHIAGVLNKIADAISRLVREEIPSLLNTLYPLPNQVAWREVQLTESTRRLCYETLASVTQRDQLLFLLEPHMERLGRLG
jgi:hypothetical protein